MIGKGQGRIDHIWRIFAVACVIASLDIGTPAQPPRARHGLIGREKCIVIESIGATSLQLGTITKPVVVREQETVVARVRSCFNKPAYLFPITRESGGPWEVQQGTPMRPSESTVLRLPVRFGSQVDSLSVRDFRLILHVEQLPVGNIPEELLTDSGAIAMSENISVQRDTSARPFVGITHIDNHPLYGSEDLPWVQDEAGIRTSAWEIPPDGWICVAIRGSRPLDSNYWVQDSCLLQSGVLNAYFGDHNLHQFFRFDVVTFVARSKFIPPRGVAISALDWDRYQLHFLAISKPVRVIKAGRFFNIDRIGGTDINNASLVKTWPQGDIGGRLNRPLGSKEHIWVLALPVDGSDPYVVTPISTELDSEWQGVGVRFWKMGTRDIEVVAVISEDDPTSIEANKLRYWINEQRKTANTVRLRVVHSKGG